MATVGRKTFVMFLGNVPNIVAIILLSGLVTQFLPIDRLSGILGGGFFADALMGAVIGSVSIGNPQVHGPYRYHRFTRELGDSWQCAVTC